MSSCVSFRILGIISSELSEAFNFFRWMYHCYCFDPFLMMSKYPSANWIHFWRPKMTVNMESKRTPKDRVLQYNKTIEKKFSEISSILSVIDHTMKTFAEKLAQLKTIKDQMPQSVQSSISSSLNAHNTEITKQPFLMMSKYPSANWIHFWPWITTDPL
jgi:hypothetical protein